MYGLKIEVRGILGTENESLGTPPPLSRSAVSKLLLTRSNHLLTRSNQTWHVAGRMTVEAQMLQHPAALRLTSWLLMLVLRRRLMLRTFLRLALPLPTPNLHPAALRLTVWLPMLVVRR